MIRPSSPPICTISHALDCSLSTPKTTCERRSKTKYWPDDDCWKPAASRKRPAICAGTAPVERRTSGLSAWIVAAKATQTAATARGFGIGDLGVGGWGGGGRRLGKSVNGQGRTPRKATPFPTPPNPHPPIPNPHQRQYRA